MKNTTEHPLLMTGDMVRAARDDRKTQTRRVMKPQPTRDACSDYIWDWLYKGIFNYKADPFGSEWPGPYGEPGDVLWVRESIRTITYQRGPNFDYGEHCIEYLADKHLVKCAEEHDEWWYHNWQLRPSMSIPNIHMPKWACRLRLTVKSVRAERLQNITKPACIVEGYPGQRDDAAEKVADWWITFWDSINAKRGYGWNENPWVWVVEFDNNSANPA